MVMFFIGLTLVNIMSALFFIFLLLLEFKPRVLYKALCRFVEKNDDGGYSAKIEFAKKLLFILYKETGKSNTFSKMYYIRERVKDDLILSLVHPLLAMYCLMFATYFIYIVIPIFI